MELSIFLESNALMMATGTDSAADTAHSSMNGDTGQSTIKSKNLQINPHLTLYDPKAYDQLVINDELVHREKNIHCSMVTALNDG